jgi:hypothetical protein
MVGLKVYANPEEIKQTTKKSRVLSLRLRSNSLVYGHRNKRQRRVIRVYPHGVKCGGIGVDYKTTIF